MRTLVVITSILTCCIFGQQTLFGQCQNVNECNDELFVKHLEIDQALAVPGGPVTDPAFVIRWPSVTGITWTGCVGSTAAGGACDDLSDFREIITDTPFSLGNGTLELVSEGSGDRLRLRGTPDTGGNILLNLMASAPGETDQTKQYSFIIREPMRLVFVLDKSGSMAGTPPGASATKWEMAEDAIMGFATGMGQDTLRLLDSDKLCIVTFQEDTVIPSGGIGDFLSVSDFDSLLPDLFTGSSALSPGGWTSIGDGMVTAVVDRHGGYIDSFRQVNVLISDGMQNRPATILDSTGKKIDGAGIDLLNTPVASGKFIDTYVIGFSHSDKPGPFEQLLSKIASSDADNDNYFYTLDIDTYTPTFTELFARVFNRFSPQIIDSRRVTVPILAEGTPPLQSTFPVNGGGKSLTFNLSFPNVRANQFNYVVLQDGVAVDTSYYRVQTGNYATVISLNFQTEPDLDSRGDWTVQAIPNFGSVVDVSHVEILDPSPIAVRGKGATTYIDAVISATLDDHQFEASYSIANDPTVREVGGVQVNTRPRPEATLRLRGQPLDSAIVTARLLEPGADKGTLIARSNIDYSVDSFSTPYQAKFAALRENDPLYLADLYDLAEDEILLEEVPKGSGHYVGRFGPLKVADNASVIFRTLYEDPDLGMIQRYHRVSAAVRFGELDHNLGALNVDPGGDNTYTLLYRPTYWVGTAAHPVGPGYGGSFRVEGANLDKVTDLGDGTYQLRLQTNGPDAQPDLFLLDEPFYQGKLADFDKPVLTFAAEISAHLGYAFPIPSSGGILDSLDQGSIAAELDFGYRLTPNWSLELIGGYYGLANQRSILGAGLHVRYRWQGAGSRANLTLAAGLGYYEPDYATGGLGFGGRLGAEYLLTQRLRLLAEVAAYSADSGNTNFGAGLLGVKYGF